MMLKDMQKTKNYLGQWRVIQKAFQSEKTHGVQTLSVVAVVAADDSERLMDP